MSGALVNIVSKGVQDAFLTGSPQVSFFRQNYKRHTNFAMKPVEITGVGSNGANQQLSFKVEPKGDLLTYIWVDVGPDAIGHGTDGPAIPDCREAGIQTGINNTPTIFELWIGGKMVDRQDAFYINNLWPKFMATTPSKFWRPENQNFMPLHFFFCDEATTPLPLIAMQYQEVEIRVKQGSFINSSPNPMRMYANMIMLDTDEREFFTNNDHELLITQVQRIGTDGTASTTKGVDLSYFNHPVKTILWGADDYSDGGAADDDLVTNDVQLVVNGNDYFDTKMPRKYFNAVSSYYHTENTLQNATDNYDGLYMLPLSLCPCKHQPTGSLNFSRVDNAKLSWIRNTGGFDDTTQLPFVYGVNYNILRVKGGMSGVMFSN